MKGLGGCKSRPGLGRLLRPERPLHLGFEPLTGGFFGGFDLIFGAEIIAGHANQTPQPAIKLHQAIKWT